MTQWAWRCVLWGRLDATPAPTNPGPTAEPAHRRAARYAEASLLARIQDVLPLRCTNCGGMMRIIALITHALKVSDILSDAGNPGRLIVRNWPDLCRSWPITCRPCPGLVCFSLVDSFA